MIGRKSGYAITVGSGKFRHSGEVFRDVQLPDGDHAQVMSRRVFESAVSKANESLRVQIKKERKIAS